MPFHLTSLKLALDVDTPTDIPAGFDQGFAEPADEIAPRAPDGSSAPAGATAVDPDNPPWGILLGFALTVATFLLMLVVQLVFIVPYVLTRGVRDPASMQKILQGDKTVILLSVVSIFPAHLLTLAVAWMIVTGFGKRPFWPSLGWGWSPRLGYLEPLACFGATILLLLAGRLFVGIFGDPETELERLILSSNGARYMIAAIATFTAPLVEEIVFRGVLYSGLRRWFKGIIGTIRYVLDDFDKVKNAWRTESLYGVISYLFDVRKGLGNGSERDGKASTVLGTIVVIMIFAAIHVPQYLPNVAAISTILLLSSVLTVVRARTGRLLPCVAIHFFFNGITSVLIVLAPYIQSKLPSPPPSVPPAPGALVELCARLAAFLS